MHLEQARPKRYRRDSVPEGIKLTLYINELGLVDWQEDLPIEGTMEQPWAQDLPVELLAMSYVENFPPYSVTAWNRHRTPSTNQRPEQPQQGKMNKQTNTPTKETCLSGQRVPAFLI